MDDHFQSARPNGLSGKQRSVGVSEISLWNKPTVSVSGGIVNLGVGARHTAGFRVKRLLSAAGVVQVVSPEDHRIRVALSPIVRGSCGSQKFQYERGDVDILPAGTQDQWFEYDSSDWIVAWIPPTQLQQVAEDIGVSSRAAGLQVSCQLRDARIEHILGAMDAERADGFRNGRLYSESLELALSIHLLGRYAQPANTKYGLSSKQLSKIAGYIEEHLIDDLSLTTLAAVVGLSPSHLKTQFKRKTGISVHQYVVQQRVARAKLLLLEGKARPSQIALEAGFTHQSHMARWMKRVLGVTPTVLVQQHP